jgi:hypothetical protein
LVSAGDYIFDREFHDTLARHRLDRCQVRVTAFKPPERTDVDKVRRKPLSEPRHVHLDPRLDPKHGQLGTAFFHRRISQSATS